MAFWIVDSGITAKEGIKCPRCGALISKDQKRCPNCLKEEKQQVEQHAHALEEKEIECPKCRTINKIGSILCQSCGINFAEFAQGKPLDMDVLHEANKRRK